MDYRKEREFIVAYDDNGNFAGKWCIINGDFYGKSNKVIKSIPQAFTYTNLYLMKNVTFSYAIRNFRDSSYFADKIKNNENCGKRLEQFISVDLKPRTERDLCSTTPLTKEIVNYCKEKNSGFYSDLLVQNYIKNKAYKSFIDTLSPVMKIVFNKCIDFIPYNTLKTFINRLTLERVENFFSCSDFVYNDQGTADRIIEKVTQYYKYSQAMYGEVKITPNFLTNCAYICALYKDFEKKNRDILLKKNNDIPVLYFNAFGFEARPILTADDFHKEGQAQSNCVERLYMPRVIENKTYIVTVRKCDNPDKSFITCEVTKDGFIEQYLGYCNRTPTDENALKFKIAYAEHLIKNL